MRGGARRGVAVALLGYLGAMRLLGEVFHHVSGLPDAFLPRRLRRVLSGLLGVAVLVLATYDAELYVEIVGRRAQAFINHITATIVEQSARPPTP
jgi:uncharacterized membrane protein